MLGGVDVLVLFTKAPGLENDEEGDEDAHLDLMSAGLGDGKAIHVRGDSIRVIRGDLKYLTGTVFAVLGDKIKVKRNQQMFQT